MPVNECTYSRVGSLACVTCTGQPEVVGVPAHVSEQPVFGWNTGANVIVSRSGNCYFKFKVPNTIVGAVAGIAQHPRDAYNPLNLTHAFQILTLSGVRVYQILERGVVKKTAAALAPGVDIEVRRVGTTIYYFVDDVQVFQSATPSNGTLAAGSVLYATGDEII